MSLIAFVWVLGGIYKVQPDEQGVVLRFGKRVETTEVGLHYHWPYPVETVLLPKVTEVRFHRADLPVETSQAIYDRMKSERQREAKELRAQGFEWAQKIQVKADRERAVLISEAQRQSKITHGEADAKANQIFAQAFGKDPQLYKFYRTQQTYRRALAESAPTLVLSPDTAFLKEFKTGPTANARR